MRQKGIELGVEGRSRPALTGYVNYSYQPEPEPEGFDISELNLPSQHHFNIGAGYNGARWLGNCRRELRQLDAYWQDVLDSRFHGPTDALHDHVTAPSATSGAAIGWSRRSRSPTCSTRRSCSTSSAT